MNGTTNDCLRTPVTRLLTSFKARSELINHLWNCHYVRRNNPAKAELLEPYLEYYSAQCDLFTTEQSNCFLASDGALKLVATHRDIVEIAKQTEIAQDRETLLSDVQSTRLALQSTRKSTALEEDICNDMINWGARLLTMTEIGKIRFAFSSCKPLVWETGSLKDFLTDFFSPGKPCTAQVRLEKAFTLHNIERLTGLEVEWTSDLASHLNLRDDDRKLLIFHHATFLTNSQTDVFPSGLREETLRSLALLLPSQNQDCGKWYLKQQRRNRLDPKAIACPRLRADDRQIESFYYWRERLCILKQLYDDAEPSTLTQWWFDRRKGPQWYTFWVAVTVLILTIFFGVIQSIEGAIQAYKAWYPD